MLCLRIFFVLFTESTIYHCTPPLILGFDYDLREEFLRPNCQSPEFELDTCLSFQDKHFFFQNTNTNKAPVLKKLSSFNIINLSQVVIYQVSYKNAMGLINPDKSCLRLTIK